MNEARRAYIEARNAFNGTWSSKQALERASMQWAEAEIRASGVKPPSTGYAPADDYLRRFWP